MKTPQNYKKKKDNSNSRTWHVDNVYYSGLLMNTQKQQGSTNNDLEIYYIQYNNRTNNTVWYYLCPIIYILLCRVYDKVKLLFNCC